MKYCPECGKPNGDVARFCEGCGKDISNITPPAPPPQQAQPMSENTKKTLRYIGAAVIIVLLALGGITAWRYFNRIPTALDISQEYLDRVKTGNYEEAYKYVNPNLKLDKDIYVYCMKKIDDQDGKVKEYRIDSDENSIQNFMPTSSSNNAAAYKNIPVVIGRNQPESTELLLTNIGTTDKADWRIDLASKIRQTSIDLPKVPKLEVKVCGSPVDVDKSGQVEFTYLGNISVPVEIGGPNVVSQTFDYPSNGTDIDLKVSAKLQKELEKVIGGYNQATIKSAQDFNMEHFEPYLMSDSQQWQDIQDYYDGEYATEPTLYTLDSVEFEKGRFLSGYEEATVELKDTEEWTSRIEESESQNTEEWTYELQLQDDGTWKISNMY